MATSLGDLIAQKEDLERRIHEAQSNAKAGAIAEIRKVMAEHCLAIADLSPTPKSKSGVRAGSKVAPKYRDPITGSTWTGRGLKPKWISTAIANGKALSDFAI